jgi:hypothetical protein
MRVYSSMWLLLVSSVSQSMVLGHHFGWFAERAVSKWLGRQSYLDDLNSLDKELYKGLISECSAFRLSLADSIAVLKNYPKPEELSLNFTITEEGTFYHLPCYID